MIITRPHKNIIRIYLDDVKEKTKAYKYLIDEGFILHRRTPYEVVRAEGSEPPTSTV